MEATTLGGMTHHVLYHSVDVLRPRMCPGQIVLFMVIFLAFKYRKKVAKQAEKFYILWSIHLLVWFLIGEAAGLLLSWRWEVKHSPLHCHQKPCSIWQTKTDYFSHSEAWIADRGQLEGPKLCFSVVIGNMIEGEVGWSVNLAFTRLLEWNKWKNELCF